MHNRRAIQTTEANGLEFHVAGFVFDNFDRACAEAVTRALRHGAGVYLDVITWTRAAAVSWAGESAGDEYDSDPESSVFERLHIVVASIGRVP